jgi:hypothetical protein
MKKTVTTQPITQAEYSALQRAYDFFNAELFAGALPQLLVTLQRHSGAPASASGPLADAKPDLFGYQRHQTFSGSSHRAAP